jgi:tetratricopeptide (TPR) repeat protein
MTAHEALGYLLLELRRPTDAFEAFEGSLRVAKNRLQSYAGATKAALSAGDFEAARAYYGKLVALTAGSNGERPEIVEVKAFTEEIGR